METNMLDMALQAAVIVSDPTRLTFLAFGVLLGLVLGIIPGLGGLVGLSLLLPFTFEMDPFTALAFMMGLQAVVVTGDTIPAVLFGVPGTIGSAATIMDGYPMARRGEAGRAFGAAFSASVIGGLFGALLLAFSIPVLRPVVLAIGSPELLAFCIFGLSLVAVLSGGSVLRGLAAAAIGLMVATAGDDSQTSTLRWTFDTTYLWDGMPIVPFALGLFAIPELADLAISRRSISGGRKVESRFSQIEGIKDVLRNPFLVLRCSGIGAVLGSVPGIGGAVIDWIAYGHAARSEKGAAESFGKGDVRGVIASESSNNAKEGGSLVPTIAFGVPGTASMALILGAFLIHGVIPGPEMLTKGLDLTYTLVWSVAIANILGAGICFVFANQLARIALVRIGILVPVVVAITYVGAVQASNSWGDLYALLAFGLLGWVMKRCGWPRPPLILGFVLGDLVERYMFISVERYEWEWLSRWPVLVLLAITAYSLLMPAYRKFVARRNGGKQAGARRWVFGFSVRGLGADTVFAALVFAAFAASLFVSAGWPFGARLVPQFIGWIGLICTGLMLSLACFVRSARPAAEKPAIFDSALDFERLGEAEVMRRAGVYFGWCLGLLGLAALIGVLPAMVLFMLGYMRIIGRESWALSGAVALIIGGLAYLLFHQLLLLPWPQSVLGDLFPALRGLPWLNIL